MTLTRVLLIILDGFGQRDACQDNAVCQARKPHWDFLWSTCPHTVIDASEKWVGLPEAQMGNSEVGHMNVGAGLQDVAPTLLAMMGLPQPAEMTGKTLVTFA